MSDLQQQLPIKVELGWLTTQPTTIEEYKLAVQQKLESYNYVVTEKNRKQAEEDKKKLTLTAKTISDSRKKGFSDIDSIKKQMIAVEHLIEDRAKAIGEQLKELDQHLLDEKYASMKAYYIGLGFNLVPFEKIVNFKWEQKNHPIEKCIELITTRVNNIKSDLETISLFGLSEEDKQEFRLIYLEHLDMSLTQQMFKLKKEREKALKSYIEENPTLLQEESQIQEEPMQNIEVHQEVKKRRVVVEFIATEPFFNLMNQLINRFKPQVRILEREEV